MCFGRVRRVLAEFNGGEGDIRPAGDHGPDEFAHALTIVDSHTLGQGGAFSVGRGRFGSIQFAEIVRCARHGDRTHGGMGRLVPAMTRENLTQVGSGTEFDIVPGLLNINTIVMYDQTLAFEILVKVGVDGVADFEVGGLIGNAKGEVINLTKKKDTLSVNRAMVDAWLMGSRGETHFVEEDIVDVSFPKAWGLGMALEGMLNGEDRVGW